jgi:ribosomal protein S18 acetylase RimI-like enzyme
MSGELKIRKAEYDDIAVLVDFNFEMARETEGLALDRALLTKGVTGIFEQAERGFYLVAESAGAVVGSLMITTEWSDWRNGDFWWVQSVYVRPENRQQGVFRELYRHVRETAMATDHVCGCRLYVEKDNSTARAAYVRYGFEETHYRLYEDCF